MLNSILANFYERDLRKLIGATLAKTGYIRDRDQEFIRKGVERKGLVTGLEQLIPLVNETLNTLNLEAEFPILFYDMKRSNSYTKRFFTCILQTL